MNNIVSCSVKLSVDCLPGGRLSVMISSVSGPKD